MGNSITKVCKLCIGIRKSKNEDKKVYVIYPPIGMEEKEHLDKVKRKNYRLEYV